MTGIADKITARIRGRGRGKWVCTPSDFLDIGSRDAVDQALSRLAKAGKLRRVGRGLYDMPRVSKVLNTPAPVDVDAAVSAISRRDGIKIMPDGIVAANRLGLTNAVPAKNSFLTDGDTRSIKVGNRTIRLRHANARVMATKDKPAAVAVLALNWLGPRASSDPNVKAIMKRRLPADVKADLRKRIHGLPAWMADVARDVVTDSVPA